MPWIIDRLAPPKGAGVFAYHHAILPDHDAFGVGMHLDGTADGSRQNRVFVVVEPHRAGLRHRGWHAVEAIEAADVWNEVGPLGECPVFCVSVIWSMLPKRSKDDDDFQRSAGRVAEGLQAA